MTDNNGDAAAVEIHGAESATEPTLRQKLAAEVIGTFILVLLGCGSAVFATIWVAGGRAQGTDLAFITTVGLSFGIAIVVAVYAFGRVSGGHFNPAVSVGAAISGRISWVTAGLYAAAQVVGAILGAFALWIVANGYAGFDSTRMGLGANTFGGGPGGYAWWAAFVLELILTAVFVWVILGTTDDRNPYSAAAPLAIGLALTAIHFVAIPATGTSVNPARSIGPALFSGGHAIGQLWLFILAPLVGGAVAGITYPLIFGRVDEPVPGSGLILPARTAAGTTPEYAGWGQQGWGGPETGATAPVPGTGHGHLHEHGPQAAAAPGSPQPTPQSIEDLPVIEQDGWRWDYAAQQWRPIDQP
ncbi:aquaporin [Nocardioides nematodiphilus]|uniref:aquaporin n=1 Tax=Nocardioides nematodiphilus TaxID=2849669 RepID=UPI001CD9D479|nr:aquaporin [Nocardioides nematodiphilus]MCA1983491.1 aquaporin [Nocardioides nematodiphilus]